MDNIFIPKNLRIGGNKNLDEYVKDIERKRESKEEEERKAKESAEQQKSEPKIIIPGKHKIVLLLDESECATRADWLKARDLVKDKGGLPSNVLHDDVLIYPNTLKSFKEQGYYPAWAKEVLIYPECDVKFKKGKDLSIYCASRNWIFPASQIPEETIGKENVALFVDPQEVEVDNKRVVILANPKSITIIYTFPQKSGWGVADPKTRIPLDKPTDGIPKNELRYLERTHAGVYPLVRYNLSFEHQHGVKACEAWSRMFGVAYVENVTQVSK